MAAVQRMLSNGTKALSVGRPAPASRLLVGVDDRAQEANLPRADEVPPARADAKAATQLVESDRDCGGKRGEQLALATFRSSDLSLHKATVGVDMMEVFGKTLRAIVPPPQPGYLDSANHQNPTSKTQNQKLNTSADFRSAVLHCNIY